MDYIPLDVWAKIFVGLPIKTLVLCTFVCKSWKSFIENPLFIQSHLQIQRRDLMLVRTRSEFNREKEAYSIYCDDENFRLYKKLDFPLTYPNLDGYFRIIGNLNGVLCIATDGRGSLMYLWNPTIRKLVELPFFRITYKLHHDFDYVLGFGYDANTNDYKVVRIVQIELYDGVFGRLNVELFSSSTGTWRNISHSAYGIKCRLIGRVRQAYVNGAAHWVVNSFRDIGLIVSFHFGREEFRCFETPFDMYCRPSEVWPVVVQESLSLVEPVCGRYVIWMMKEYGNSNTWTKYLDIYFTDKVERLIGFRRRGELLIQVGRMLVSFNYKKAGGKEPNILRTPVKLLGIVSKEEHHCWPPSLFCESYTVSLALIGKSVVTQAANHGQ